MARTAWIAFALVLQGNPSLTLDQTRRLLCILMTHRIYCIMIPDQYCILYVAPVSKTHPASAWSPSRKTYPAIPCLLFLRYLEAMASNLLAIASNLYNGYVPCSYHTLPNVLL